MECVGIVDIFPLHGGGSGSDSFGVGSGKVVGTDHKFLAAKNTTNNQYN